MSSGSESSTRKQPQRPYSCRPLIQLAGAATVSTALGGLTLSKIGSADAETPQNDEAEHEWAFVIDLRRCDGCEDCMIGDGFDLGWEAVDCSQLGCHRQFGAAGSRGSSMA